MESKPRKRYTAEFKAQGLALLTTGKPVSQVAHELCISSNLSTNEKATRRAPNSRAKAREPEARGPQRTSCILCGAKTYSSKWKTILKKAAVILGIKTPANFGK